MKLTMRIALALIVSIAVLSSSRLVAVKAVNDIPVIQPSLMENIGRSLVAIRRTNDVYVGWRMLGTDASGVTFDLYRSANGDEPVKLNDVPITATTDFVDSTADLTASNAYFVRPVVDGVELGASNTFTLAGNAPVQQFLSVPIQQPPGGTSQQAPGNTTGQSAYTYNANDATVADLDGDGQYEIILKWDPSNSRDNASAGLSGPVIIDAYKLDGTLMWRINLGKNIRAGAHYTQFMVYDLDGDGKAELMCKTADGSVDGVGNVIGDATKDYRGLTIPSDSDQPAPSTSDQRFGKILAGPEFLTVFNGETGAAMATTDYYPTRYPLDGWGGNGGNGGNDSTGNRVDRFLAAVAYLDGVRPSVVFARGYYGRSVLVAYDWRNGQLTRRWIFDSVNRDNPFSGQGAHAVSVADVDGDGKDEIIYHSMVVDDDGTGLFSTGLRHGDALHVTDLDPQRPGLEVFGVHETENTTNPLFQSPASALYDARTGEILWSNNPATDAGRGICADIDPAYLGAECWGPAGGTRDIHTGNPIYSQSPSSANFAVWWDADLSRELEDGTSITKWNPITRTTGTLLNATGTASNNGTKSTPVLTADLLGDWREEVVWRASNNQSLRIYTTTIPANNRFRTLMHDRQYRMAIAWQNVGYNQPPHPSFYLGNGMSEPPTPNIITTLVPPTINVPQNIIAEATDPNGATVDYAATASDLVGTSLPVTYSIAPGSVFPLGTTPVTVSATDIYGTTVTGTFSVTVQDTTATVVSRHSPTLNGGRIDGQLRVNGGENFNINSGVEIVDLYLAGTPTLKRNNGSFGSSVNDGGAIAPSNYQVTLNGGTLNRTHVQSDPFSFPTDIPASIPQPTGTRNISINSPADVNSIGDWSSVRSLTINVANLTLDVPAGNYYSFTVNGYNSRLKFSGGTYNFSSTIILNNSSVVESTGLTTINIEGSLTLNGGQFAASQNTPTLNVVLNVLGNLTINANSAVAGEVRVPNGSVTLNGGNATVRGNVWADRFTLNGNAKVTF